MYEQRAWFFRAVILPAHQRAQGQLAQLLESRIMRNRPTAAAKRKMSGRATKPSKEIAPQRLYVQFDAENYDGPPIVAKSEAKEFAGSVGTVERVAVYDFVGWTT